MPEANGEGRSSACLTWLAHLLGPIAKESSHKQGSELLNIYSYPEEFWFKFHGVEKRSIDYTASY